MLRALARHGTLVRLGFTGGRKVVLDVLDLIGGDKKIAGYGIHADRDANISKALTELVDLARRRSLKPKIDTVVPLEFGAGAWSLDARTANSTPLKATLGAN